MGTSYAVTGEVLEAALGALEMRRCGVQDELAKIDAQIASIKSTLSNGRSVERSQQSEEPQKAPRGANAERVIEFLRQKSGGPCSATEIHVGTGIAISSVQVVLKKSAKDRFRFNPDTKKWTLAPDSISPTQ